MKKIYIIIISFRNLLETKLRSTLTILGVAIGVGAIVFLLSLGYGIERMIVGEVASPNVLSVFEVSLNGRDITSISDANIAKIRNLQYVEKIEPGFILAGRAVNGVIKTDLAVLGLSRESLYLSDTKIIKGKIFEDDDEEKMLISTGALNALSIHEDDFEKTEVSAEIVANKNLSLSLEDGSVKSISDLKISGIIDDDKTPFIILPFKKVRKLMSTTEYNTAKVKVTDKKQLPEVRIKVEKIGLATIFIGDTITQINSLFIMFRYFIGLFGAIAIVVAILGMLNTLTVSLIERTQEIGILKSNGAQKRDVLWLFLSEALIISFAGGILGVTIGITTGGLINWIFNIYAKGNGGRAADFFYIPISYVFITVIVTMAVGLLVGIFPAKRASKIKVLDAMKYA